MTFMRVIFYVDVYMSFCQATNCTTLQSNTCISPSMHT